MGPKKDPKKQVVQTAVQQQPPPIPAHDLQGYGKFEYIDGAVYEGRWKLINGKKAKNGEGILKVPGNQQTNLGAEAYEGGWEDDKMSGYGVYKYANGATYKGQWKNNKQHGKGEYEFPNGTIYIGEWENHSMHGTGFYVDTQGRKWEGQFRRGRFQSKLQKQLIKEAQVILKKKQLTKDIEKVIQNMLQAIAKSDKKTLKENLSPFFPSGEIIKQQFKDPTTKFDERPPQKWTQVLSILKNGKVNILSSNTSSQVLQAERILKPQLEGPGQIIQITNTKDQRNTKAAFVNVQSSSWVLCFFIDQEKKGK